MNRDSMIPEVPQEGVRPEDRARLPTATTAVAHHGIHLTLTRSSSKDMASTTATTNLLNSGSQQQQSSRVLNPPTLNSSGSTSSLNAQRITLGSGQARPNVTFVRLNTPNVQQLPPVQRIVLRDQLTRPETPERVIHQRFTVKSVDRDNSTISCERTKQIQPTTQPFRFTLNELINQQLEIAAIRFNERVAEETLRTSHELAKLEHRLRSQETDLNTKNEELARAKVNFEQMLKEQAAQHKALMDKTLAEVYRHERSKLQSISSSTRQEIDRSFEYVAGRVRDIENKIRLVVESHESQSQQLRSQNDKVHGMTSKLQEIRNELTSVLQHQLQKLKEKLEKSVSEKEKVMQLMESELDKLKAQQSGLETASKSSMQRLDRSLAETSKELKEAFDRLGKGLNSTTLSSIDTTKLTPIRDAAESVRQRLDEIEYKSKLDMETMTKLLKEYSQSLNILSMKHLSEDNVVQSLQNNQARLTSKLESTEAKYQAAQRELQKLSEQYTQLKGLHEPMEVALQQTTTKLEECLKNNSLLESRYTEIVKTAESIERQLKEKTVQLKELQARNLQLQTTVRRTSANLEESTRQNGQLRGELKLKHPQLNKQSEKITTLRSSLQNFELVNSQLVESVKDLQKKLFTSEQHVNDLEAKIATLNDHKNSLECSNKQLQANLSQLSLKLTHHNSVPEQVPLESTIQLSRTQSIKCIEPSLNMQSSKGSSVANSVSFKSEARLQSSQSRNRGSNKKESSDQDSNASGFYYRQSTIKLEQQEQPKSTQSTLQKKRRQDLPAKLSQLKGIQSTYSDTLKASRKPLPLSCEIDQTGYLKDADQGTYIYDRQGNLFQLSSEQLSKAVLHRVIALLTL